MPYENIPGVKATYLDGAFKIPNASSQQKILVVGPAESGDSTRVFTVTNVSLAEDEFGSDTEVLRATHEAVAQGADNISIMRSGGRKGSWVLTDSASQTLTIVPDSADDNILGRYKLFIENNGSVNRYLIYDAIDQAWVYDSDEILVLDDGAIDVTDTGIDLFTLFDKTDISSASTLDTVVVGDFTADGVATASSILATEGTDGTAVSRVERYAALADTYHMLDYRDADMIIPTGVYVDDLNIADDATAVAAGTGSADGELYGYYFKGAPAPDEAEDALGYVWQWRYKGKVYTYFTDVSDYFTGVGTEAVATITVNTDLVLTAAKAGKGGNALSIEINAAGTAGPTVSITETDHGLDVLVTDDGTATTSTTASAIDAALALFTMKNGQTADSLFAASAGAVTTLTTVAKTNLAGGLGGAVLTHQDLTGEAIPTAVSTKFAAGSDSELREVNFGHQLATFCYVASTNWSQMLGAISFKAPPSGFSRSKIAEWVGVLPEFTDNGTDLYIDAPADNGSGILGHKLLIGESKSSAGYRSGQIEGGNATDSYAWGGFIMTEGDALPNGDDWPYGINDADERLDSGGKVVDIGKHLLVTYDWPILTNGFDGGTSYRGSLPSTLFGKIVGMPENEEPIGANGKVTRVQAPARVHSTQINDLAKARIIGLRRDIDNDIIFTTSRTAAHPDSDYTRLSTIRSVNRMLSGIRQLARPYIGKDFSAQRLASLQSALDAFVVSERAAGIHQGAKTRIEYTQQDRIMGRLKIKLRMVPPFTIEFIDVETSLAADESEL